MGHGGPVQRLASALDPLHFPRLPHTSPLVPPPHFPTRPAPPPRYFYCTAFGLGRALHHMQQLNAAESGGAQTLVDRDSRGIELRIAKLENDLTSATFDVIADVGPSSSTKRQATVRALTGTVTIGMVIAGTGVTTGTYVASQLTGPTGGAGCVNRPRCDR